MRITFISIAHDIFRHSSQGTYKQAYTPIASQFQVKMSCIACLRQLSIKHKDIKFHQMASDKPHTLLTETAGESVYEKRRPEKGAEAPRSALIAETR